MLLEDDVHLPGLDEDGCEHDGGAEAAEELQEAAGAGAEPRVQEEDAGELAQERAAEQEGEEVGAGLLHHGVAPVPGQQQQV